MYSFYCDTHFLLMSIALIICHPQIKARTIRKDRHWLGSTKGERSLSAREDGPSARTILQQSSYILDSPPVSSPQHTTYPLHIIIPITHFTALIQVNYTGVPSNLHSAGDVNLAYEILVSRGIAPMSSPDHFRDPFKASSPYIEDSDISSDFEVPLTSAFAGHRDTLALIRFRKLQVSAIELPSELLQQVYRHLSPQDFDTVRHTCRKWFLASLDKSLLQKMTRRAGCAQAAREDVQLRKSLDIDGSTSDEWLLSKRLATEARVTPGKHCIYALMTIKEEVNFDGI